MAIGSALQRGKNDYVKRPEPAIRRADRLQLYTTASVAEISTSARSEVAADLLAYAAWAVSNGPGRP